MIGAGQIARSHIDAAIRAGFHVAAICGRPNSSRAKEISLSYPNLEYFIDVDHLMECQLDALTIAVSVDETADLLRKVLKKNVPILVEKPVTTKIEEIRNLEILGCDKVLVGFNRRHYGSVINFRQELRSLSSGSILFQIPELSWEKSSTPDTRRANFLENAIHMLDLLQFLFGHIEISESVAVENHEFLNYSITPFRTTSHDIGVIFLGFNTPDNYCVKYWNAGICMELLPIENFAKYESIIKKRNENQSKEYIRLGENEWLQDSDDLLFKPGFVSQYMELLQLVNTGSFSGNSARIFDARRALELGHKILEKGYR